MATISFRGLMMSEHRTELLGQSPEIKRLLNAVRMVAATRAPVVIRGENGSGREALAREIHSLGAGKDRAFVPVPCVGLNPEALSEVLQKASGGTLFLSGVGDLSAAMQTGLLASLRGEVLAGDIRVIASSGLTMESLVAEGAFRADLYYQLNVVPLDMPALRDRKDDILLLLKQFTRDYASRYGRRAPSYSVTARNLIRSYRWPGNLLELRNLCERMVILTPGAEIRPENLPAEFQQKEQKAGSDWFQIPAEGINLFAVERDIIVQALKLAHGNKSKAARLLGLSRDTFLYRLRKYEVQADA